MECNNGLNDTINVRNMMRSLEEQISTQETENQLHLLRELIKTPSALKQFMDDNGPSLLVPFLTQGGEISFITAWIMCHCIKDNRNVKSLVNKRTFKALSSCFDGKLSYKRQTVFSTLLLGLVQQSTDSQNLARESTCLTKLGCLLHTQISYFIINKGQVISKEMYQSLEHTVYTICGCISNPINPVNQSVVCWVIPQIIKFLLTFLPTADFKITSSILSLVRDLLHNSTDGQEIFLQCSGCEVLFSYIDNIEISPIDNYDMIRRYTGVLLNLRHIDHVLKTASEMKIMKSMLAFLTINNLYVIRNLLLFLENMLKVSKDDVNDFRNCQGVSLIQLTMDKFGFHDVRVRKSIQNINKLCAVSYEKTSFLPVKPISIDTQVDEDVFVIPTKSNRTRSVESQTTMNVEHSDTVGEDDTKYMETSPNNISNELVLGNGLELCRSELRQKERALRSQIRSNVLDDSKQAVFSTKSVGSVGSIFNTPFRIMQKWSSMLLGSTKDYNKIIKDAHLLIAQREANENRF